MPNSVSFARNVLLKEVINIRVEISGKNILTSEAETRSRKLKHRHKFL
jgi:hypothetical protein